VTGVPVFPYAPHDAVLAVPEERADVEPPEAPAARDFSERLLRSFLGMCESPRSRDRVLRLVQASVRNGAAGRRFYGFVNRAVVHPVARLTGVHASALRVELVCGQLVGLAMMRYVLEVEPVASADLDEVVRQ
jgi:hypothetical protein